LPGPLPEQFGHYRILRRLGAGGMGTVYLAEDTKLDRRVALKVPHFAGGSGTETLERLAREARIAAAVDHPNLCPVYEAGRIDGIDFLTMAFIPGKSLSEFIAPGRPLPQKPVAALVRKLAEALQAAHTRGVIHRDLKPANVMITPRGQPVIMDFGVARDHKAGDARLTPSGTMLGTPAYLAPEQLTGDLESMGPGCDVYSLGVILYELLTGRVPFQGPPLRVLVQVLEEEPAPPSDLRADVDPGLEAICRKAMARKREDRYASMAEFAQALQTWLGDDAAALALALPEFTASHHAPTQPEQPGVTPPAPSRPAQPAAAPTRRRWWRVPATAVTLGLLVGVAVAAWHWLRDSDHMPIETGEPTPPPAAAFQAQPQAVGLPHSPEIVNVLEMRLVRIPAGKFLMGSPASEATRFPDEGPQHGVDFRQAFYLGKYEVTQGQYRRLMGTNPSRFARGGEGASAVHDVATEDFPVENVSWDEAMEFCRRLSELAEEKQAGRLYELPTEAEWEYACRAGTTTPFSFGGTLNGQQANCAGDFPYGTQQRGPYRRRTCRVGSFPANAWGLCDMHGNVREWCRDWYDKGYYLSGENTNPQGPGAGQYRVLRGGGWDESAEACRAAYRSWLRPESRGGVGFRVCFHPD
jgi:formylglycine-generating enzyme required for sulfatase activity